MKKRNASSGAGDAGERRRNAESPAKGDVAADAPGAVQIKVLTPQDAKLARDIHTSALGGSSINCR